MARSRMVTQANRREWRKIIVALEAARKAIWHYAPNRDARFNDCFALATPTERAAFEALRAAESAFEAKMIAEGRGYRDSLGVFMPYGVSLLSDPRVSN